MKVIAVSFLLFFTLLDHFTRADYPNFYPPVKQLEITEDAGNPLILTTYIEQNKIEEARTAAEVNLADLQGVKSFAGYFTVNEAYDSNLFFWFFPSESDYANDPVVLWLQGGPGTSSMFGLFDENGPFIVSEAGVTLRDYSWSKSHSVIYIDNPVGTGFSFTEGGYASDETQIGEELYNALQQFFTIFYELQQNEFYIAGESYAGKYIPAIGYTIHTKNPDSALKINLQGLAIGNGLSDPEHQITYGDYLYQIGLIDSNVRETSHTYEQQAVEYIEKGEFDEAQAMIQKIIGYDGILSNAAGYNNVYNYLYPNEIPDSPYGSYIQRTDVRSALHVGNTPFGDDNVGQYLANDITKTVANWVSELLNNYRVLIYSGQMDIIVAYPVTLNYLQNLDFNGAEEYKTAPRYQWYVGSDLAGYVKQAGNLIELLVRDAGHMVPQDQPKWASDLIYRFTRNKSFSN